MNKLYAVTHIDLFTNIMLTSFIEATDEFQAVVKAGYPGLVRKITKDLVDVRYEALNQESMIEVKEVPARENTYKDAEYKR